MSDLTFSEIYERYAQDVFRFAWYLSGDRALAEDIAAEAFSRAWVAWDRIQVGTVKAYLLTIARNLYRDVTRKHEETSLRNEWDVASTALDPESLAIARGELHAVLAGLRNLPEMDRSLLLMATVGGVPYDAIAVAFGLSTAAVKVRVHRARLKLNAARSAKEQP